MFSVSPAKRSRKDGLAGTITAIGQSIASALSPGVALPLCNMRYVTQVCRISIIYRVYS